MNALTVTCDFSRQSWANMGSVYTCSVKDLTVTTREVEVTEIEGEHFDEHDNSHVKKLNIQGQDCEYLPKGFEKFFPNLEGLRVAQSNLVSIQQSDLSVHPNLRNCDMFNNKLTVLDEDLFAKNPKLEYLYFGDNGIKSVGHDILASLQHLHTAVFQGNECIKENANSHDDMQALQKILNRECGAEIETTTRASDYEIITPPESNEYRDEYHEHSSNSDADYGFRNDTSEYKDEDEDEEIQGNGFNYTISDDLYNLAVPQNERFTTQAILALIALIAVTVCIAVLCVIKSRRNENARRSVVLPTSVEFKNNAPAKC